MGFCSAVVLCLCLNTRGRCTVFVSPVKISLCATVRLMWLMFCSFSKKLCDTEKCIKPWFIWQFPLVHDLFVGFGLFVKFVDINQTDLKKKNNPSSPPPPTWEHQTPSCVAFECCYLTEALLCSRMFDNRNLTDVVSLKNTAATNSGGRLGWMCRRWGHTMTSLLERWWPTRIASIFLFLTVNDNK